MLTFAGRMVTDIMSTELEDNYSWPLGSMTMEGFVTEVTTGFECGHSILPSRGAGIAHGIWLFSGVASVFWPFILLHTTIRTLL